MIARQIFLWYNFNMKFKFLLTDIDETILSFEAAERFAFDKIHKDNGLNYTKDDFLLYKRINDRIWSEYERGTVSVRYTLEKRFEDYVSARGLHVSGTVLAESYEAGLALDATLLENDIPSALEFISGRAPVYAISNGLTSVQRSRLKLCGLDKYFSGMFISGEIGLKKPNKDYFDYVESHIPGFDKKNALLVGDSLSADMPAAKHGYRTCLVDHSEKGVSCDDYPPEFRVKKFSDIVDFF